MHLNHMKLDLLNLNITNEYYEIIGTTCVFCIGFINYRIN